MRRLIRSSSRRGIAGFRLRTPIGSTVITLLRTDKSVSPWNGDRAMHNGIDIATSPGAAILAPADGVVVFNGTRGGYGKMLIIDHGYGVETRYGHNQENFVTVGQKVARGQKIATVGNTGRSTGPHLHYEVRLNGIPENPRRYILEE